MSYRKEHEEYRETQKAILYGMAKGPWASWWANEQEEKGRSFSGLNIYDLCPKPPKAAMDWAKSVYAQIFDMNYPNFVTSLFNMAKKEGFSGDAEQFGFYLGCEASGMGISWDDNLSTNLKIIVPQREFYV